MVNALVALVPLGLALILLVVFRQNSRIVGFVTLLATAILVFVFPPFRLAPFRLLVSFGTGVAGSLTLLTVLLPALILYQVQRVGGAMAVLVEMILRITPDQEILALLLVFGLAPLLDTLCGMNVGVFVITPILLSLGLSPLRVACLNMISMVTSVWGTMGVVVLLISHATGVPSAIVGGNSAILLMPATLCLCAVALWVMGREIRLILRAWLPVVGTSAILTGGAWMITRVAGVELVGMITDSITMLFLALLGRVQAARIAGPRGFARREGILSLTQWQIWKAVLPYAVLVVFLFVSRIVPSLEEWLQSHMVLSVPLIKLAFPVLYLPGLWLLVIAVLASLLLRLKASQVNRALSIAWRQFVPSAIAITSFLAAAQTMQESGMIAAFGGVATTLGSQYVWVSPWLGGISGWATGSTISGNSLFSTLQQSIATRTGLPVSWIVAAQNTASSIGKIVSPTSAILAASAAGIPGLEGLILRKVGFPTLLALALLTAVLGIATSHFAGATLLLISVTALFVFFVVRNNDGRVAVASSTTTTVPTSSAGQNDSEKATRPRIGQQSRDLLTLLEQTPQGMSRAGISAAFGQPASVVHRLLQTLLAQGYIRRSGNLYVIEHIVTDPATQDARSTTPTDVASPSEDVSPQHAPDIVQKQEESTAAWSCLLPHIQKLAQLLQESAYLAVLEEGQVVSVAVARPERLLCFAIKVGCRLPLLNSGCGKVLLAYQQEAVRTTLVRSAVQTRRSGSVDLDQVAIEAQLVQHCGYAIDDEDLEDGVRSFAVPVQDERGVLVAALAISGPSHRLSMQRLASIIEEMGITGAEMTDVLRRAKVA